MSQHAANEIVVVIHPFERLSDDLPDRDRHLRSDLMTALSRFRQFTVAFAESPGPGPGKVDYAVRGSMLSLNNGQPPALRITLQLTDERQCLIWADHFEVSASLLHTQVVDTLVSSLQQQINMDLLRRRRQGSRATPSAYECWLYGMEEVKKGSLQADETAREHFMNAMTCDPFFSLAYSGMSLTYFNEWSCQLWERWEINHRGAYKWARKAFDLDQQNGTAALVLGRVHLYEADFEKGEYYLREALRLNPTDADNLMQIATCFVFLGDVDTAQELYDRATRLNPIGMDQNYHVGSFIALEKGDYDRAIELGLISTLPWVDFRAMLAAAYFLKGDQIEMSRWWQAFLDEFALKINKGKTASSDEALQWLLNISPYRTASRQEPFWQFIRGNESIPQREFVRAIDQSLKNTFAQEGRLWNLVYAGTSVFVADSKGMHDIAKLVANPTRNVHCAELLGAHVRQTGAVLFDEKARRNYQERIRELREEIELAESHNNSSALPSLHEEYESILAHVSASIDRKGRVRKVNDNDDKARSAVTWRIRSAIQKIGEVHPALAKHLSGAVRTGFYCSYNPDTPVDWSL